MPDTVPTVLHVIFAKIQNKRYSYCSHLSDENSKGLMGKRPKSEKMIGSGFEHTQLYFQSLYS